MIQKPTILLMVALILTHFSALCCHATMGGWQFGNRYTVDALPVLFCALMLLLQGDERDTALIMYPLCLWGLGLNLVGTVALYNGWL